MGGEGGRIERNGGGEKEVNIVLTTWKRLNNNLNGILDVAKKPHVAIFLNSNHFIPV